MPHALVSGASIAGLSTAFWLTRAGWQVTVLERHDGFRDGGQNVDVRGVAHRVLDRMGLTDAVRALNTTETGTVLVDEHGEVRVELPSDGPDGATAELEILRGDLAGVVRDALPDGVEFVYGDPVTTVDDAADAVTVTLHSGRTLVADLLVVAEGVRSTTRDLVFGADEVDRHELGITMAFGTIARTGEDDDRWRWFTTVGGRQVHLRPDPHGTTRAILAYARGEDLTPLDRPEQLAALRATFHDAGWAAPRILAGFETTDDLYVDHLAQIAMSTYHRGRVVVTGDAAWCVTPLGGGGASLALTGGYVLAAFLSTEPGLDTALGGYESWMRPLVDDVQGLPPGLDRFAFPESRVGLAVKRFADKVLTSAPLRPLAARLTEVADDDRELPDLRAADA